MLLAASPVVETWSPASGVLTVPMEKRVTTLTESEGPPESTRASTIAGLVGKRMAFGTVIAAPTSDEKVSGIETSARLLSGLMSRTDVVTTPLKVTFASESDGSENVSESWTEAPTPTSMVQIADGAVQMQTVPGEVSCDLRLMPGGLAVMLSTAGDAVRPPFETPATRLTIEPANDFKGLGMRTTAASVVTTTVKLRRAALSAGAVSVDADATEKSWVSVEFERTTEMPLRTTTVMLTLNRSPERSCGSAHARVPKHVTPALGAMLC
eukprot:Amastigsp_a841220_227.p2 type:complete len:268 gc:universal Amastigsp_a841220_227:1848-1045(-)